jgi:diguanylate cyclase (GGDEF)-like protein/PAS domain S-box-containing protein
LETFVLAIEEGSIARAAGRLGISAPSAAKRIRGLEALAQDPLLVRGRRGVTATEAGARLYPVARELLGHRSRLVGALTGAPAADPLRIAGIHQLLGAIPVLSTEELFKASESVLSAIFHASADAILITRAQDGLIDEVNDAAVRLLGYDRDDVRGGKVSEVEIWEDSARRDELVHAAVLSREPQRAELVLRARGGDRRLVTARFEAIELREEIHVLITIRALPKLLSAPGVGVGGARGKDRVGEELADRFLEALWRGEPKAAEAVADEALDRGVDVAAVHTALIEPAMRAMGELWERNRVSVAEEHLATAICHDVAARVFWRALGAPARSRERVMLAAVQGEQHVLGLRLAADVLEGAGYDVLYLGTDVPLQALLDACRIHRPDVLGFTVSMSLHVPTMIWEIHELTKLDQPPRVMTGGRAAAVAVPQGLSAPVVEHCEQVLAVIERLLGAPPSPSVVSPALAARVALRAPSGPIAAEQLDTISAAFSATSLAAADSVRESARRAFEMERLAYRDALTGLFNRRAFEDRIAAVTDHELLHGALLMIDVDKLKAINDTYGHESGDQTLVAVARAILGAIRVPGFAARLGGDEFVVLLPATTGTDADRIADRITTAVTNQTSSPPVTVSVGIADLSCNARLASRSADRALYLAKQSGGNTIARAAP